MEKKGWSIPDLRDGKQVWYELVKNLVKLPQSGEKCDLNAVPFTGDLVNTRTWRQKELSRLDKICERLSAAATNSVLEGKNPVLASEEAISDIFSYIGFKTEHVGGAGDTDVVLKWKDNDDIVVAIVDGKSLSKRFII